ncbi:MAG: SRPBCC domain-containing protein [Gammaproteobacteria bacterium]|nr:MAG: SRPBCC domain-containing protein [Gammaproteobacteria bacterium]
MTDLTVNITRTIHAPIEQVFDAWLNPELLTRFILPAPGMPQPEVENDPRENGRFTIIMHVGDDHVPHTGSYLELDRPRRLVFSWESPYSTDDSTVTLDFAEIDSTTTRVELTHVKFLHEEARSNHEGGWGNILDRLNELL